jgi:Ca2+/H+ antiporter
MSEDLSNYIILISVLIFLTIGTFFIGFFEGPQIGHYINIFTVILNIVLTLRFLKKNKSKLLKAWYENRTKLILATFGTLIQLCIAITFMNIKYGYTNWTYMNPIELIPPH